MSEFLIKPAKDGCEFDLVVGGDVLCTSEVYTTKVACKNSIASVTKNATLNKIEDQSAKQTGVTNPKFKIFTDKAGKIIFHLTASNGKIIAVSKAYDNVSEAKKVVAQIVKEAPKAKIKEA